MKKILSLIILLIVLSGCGSNTARMSVENYLKKYKTLDSEVLVDMEGVIAKEDLTKDQEEKYRNILKKQYKDLTYEVISEEYDDEVSYVTVKINVYDLYQAQSDALVYLENNKEEFYTNGEYDLEKYVNYKLDKMLKKNDRIDYTLVFTVTKENNEYIVSELGTDEIKKIHAIYNYELS